MPTTPIPADLEAFLLLPNASVVATVRPDGELSTAATWYEYMGDQRILLNMDVTRVRLGHLRKNPRVALTVLGADWGTHVSVSGHVDEIRHDTDLADIDRISSHYIGEIYPDRERDSWSAIFTISRWHGWGAMAR